ncbi:hypothetical protein SH668x_001285 [Planctomicrobium sp. SH668]|uniref:hypothetical protein n=1 Tax=Planctomicrobium sp. SH668 TaxID=3448126 RepID=UPI003F5BADB0
MSTMTPFKGLEVVDEATDSGGTALTGNFRELADRAPFRANGNPATNSDSSLGFACGDQWLNTSGQMLWSCVTASVGVAVWKSVLKRTATALDLIPQETGEKVHVRGNLEVDGTSQLSGSVQLPSGTASSPALAFGNDVSSGLYSVSADVLGFATGGVETVRFSNTGTTFSKPITISTDVFNGATISRTGAGGAGLQLNVSSGHSTHFGMANVATPNYFAGQVGGGLNFLFASAAQLSCNSGSKIGWVSSTDAAATVDTYFMRASAGGISTPGQLSVSAFNLATSSPPASSSAAGNVGDIRWGTSYVYLCVATDTWKRTPLPTW